MLVDVLHLYIFQGFAQQQNIFNQSVPSRTYQRQQPERSPVTDEDPESATLPSGDSQPLSSGHKKMNLAQVWKFLEEAREKNVSLHALAKIRVSDESGGVKPGGVHHWLSKWLWMYHDRVQLTFGSCLHLNLVTDSSCHGCKDTLVTVCFSSENGQVAFASSQHMNPCKVLYPGELDLDNEVSRICARREQERLHSYRFMQAISNQMKEISGGRLSLESLRPANTLCLKPLQPGDRVEELRDGRVKFFFKGSSDPEHGILQDFGQVHQLPLLSILMDQGPSGCASAAFLNHQGLLLHCQFDKIHRLVRDIKLASSAAKMSEGLAMSSFAWSANYKPFRSGNYFEEKKGILNAFLNSESVESDIFLQYLPWLIADFGLPADVSSEEVWSRVAELSSWNRKESLVKKSRWFSWNEAAEIHMPEFHASRMLLDWYYGGEIDPDDESLGTFKKCKDKLGGLKLCLKCFSTSTWQSCEIYRIVTRPCWTWYTGQVKHVKTPEDNIAYLQVQANNWQRDKHLLELAQLANPISKSVFSHLFEMSDDANLPDDILCFIVELLAQRAGSLSKHSTPPECYAAFLLDDPVASSAAQRQMVSDFKMLQKIELSNAPEAANLASDCRLSCDAPTRLALNLMYVGKTAGSKMVLNALLTTLPDAKIVEDCHQVVRTAQKSRGNERLSTTTVQGLLQNSVVLSSRHLKHGAQINQDTFFSEFQGAGRLNARQVFGGSCKLDKEFGNILAPKKWPTISEPNLIVSAAAWQWLRHYVKNKLAQSGVALQVGWQRGGQMCFIF